jgi:transposase
MAHKALELTRLSVRQLRARRRELARELRDLETTLRGSLVSQGRRCGKEGCGCRQGDLHGPYVYLSVGRRGGASRLLYVPTDLAAVVRRRVTRTGRIDGTLAEISAINLELLVRRELD